MSFIVSMRATSTASRDVVSLCCMLTRLIRIVSSSRAMCRSLASASAARCCANASRTSPSTCLASAWARSAASRSRVLPRCMISSTVVSGSSSAMASSVGWIVLRLARSERRRSATLCSSASSARSVRSMSALSSASADASSGVSLRDVCPATLACFVAASTSVVLGDICIDFAHKLSAF